eukprot:Sspe_Gene.19610::Locus_7158_Transcript_1_1_Confidence_1.000_Length_2057::g.19610::m.19610
MCDSLGAGLQGGPYDHLKLAGDARVSSVLFPMGESVIQVSDTVAVESAGGGPPEQCLVMTQHTLYLLTSEGTPVHTFAMPAIEQVVWDPDGLTFIIAPLDLTLSPVMVRCSEGGRRYHLHSTLRRVYEAEAFKPLPSTVGKCSLPHADHRRRLLLRIKAASSTLPSSEVDGLQDRLTLIAGHPDEIETLEGIAVRLEASPYQSPPRWSPSAQDVQSRSSPPLPSVAACSPVDALRAAERLTKEADEVHMLRRTQELEDQLAHAEKRVAELREERDSWRCAAWACFDEYHAREWVHLAEDEEMVRCQHEAEEDAERSMVYSDFVQECARVLVTQREEALRSMASEVRRAYTFRGRSSVPPSPPSRRSPSPPPAPSPLPPKPHPASPRSVTFPDSRSATPPRPPKGRTSPLKDSTGVLPGKRGESPLAVRAKGATRRASPPAHRPQKGPAATSQGMQSAVSPRVSDRKAKLATARALPRAASPLRQGPPRAAASPTAKRRGKTPPVSPSGYRGRVETPDRRVRNVSPPRGKGVSPRPTPKTAKTPVFGTARYDPSPASRLQSDLLQARAELQRTLAAHDHPQSTTHQAQQYNPSSTAPTDHPTPEERLRRWKERLEQHTKQ